MQYWLARKRGRVITTSLSLAWLCAGGLLLEGGITVLSPLGERSLATAAWLLAFLLLSVATWAGLLWYQLRSYKKHYPDHEKDLIYEKYFNEFADQKKRK